MGTRRLTHKRVRTRDQHLHLRRLLGVDHAVTTADHVHTRRDTARGRLVHGRKLKVIHVCMDLRRVRWQLLLLLL